MTRISSGGVELVSLAYDAFDRRVVKSVAGAVRETVWNGWRPVETYEDGLLVERRIYGSELDEVVSLQQDTDGDGVLDATRVPWYDSTGNVAMMTREDGVILERYDYTPFGENEVRVDLDPPQVERVTVGPTLLELALSEEVSLDELGRALADGDVEATEDSSGESVTIDLEGLESTGQGLSAQGLSSVTAGQTVSAGSRGNPLRRSVLFTVANPPAAGTQVTLSIASSSLVDSFQNPLSAPFTVSFPWPSSETVVADAAAPRVESVYLIDGHLVVTFSEPRDPSTVPAGLAVTDSALTWTAEPGTFTYRSDQSLDPGSYSLTVDDDLLDVSGLTLTQELQLAFEVTPEGDRLVVYELPDPTLVSATTIGNHLGFHGLELDPESGLYYARHRYYDPELGRFLTPDPLGYVDGPNSYQYALNNPVNFSDRMGLKHDTLFGTQDLAQIRLHKESEEARRQERIAAKAIAARLDEAEAQALFCAVDPMGEEPAHRRLGLHHHFAQMGHPASVVRDKVMAQGGPAGYHVNQTDRLFSELSFPEFKPYADLYVQLVDLMFAAYSGAESVVGPGLWIADDYARLGVPQGLSAKRFSKFSRLVRGSRAGRLSDDIAVHGSRAAGTARPTSDIDIAIRVSRGRFNQLIEESFRSVNPGSARERTMLHAIKTGKIHAGRVGLHGVRRDLARELGMPVDLSVIRIGGAFDQGPYIWLR